MRALPFATRLLLLWLGATTMVPALVGLAEAVGLLGPGVLPFAVLGAALAALLGLVLFEPPRSRSPRVWFARLRVRLVPSPLPSDSSPPSSRQEQ